uniref:Uncharacterized protein n=1 Tax=viral metagenome TaxID=1070528 RepID=A0A6C0EQU2_9ZZZZ
MTSIGYTSSINGSYGTFNPYIVNPKNKGGAINGFMTKQVQTNDNRYPEFEQIRFTLKNAWNTTYPSQLRANKLTKSITTPFRAVNNAGDLLGRENFSCGGSCQSFQSRPGMFGLSQRFGSTSSNCQPSVAYNSLQLNKSIPSATCNVKYVYDSSDYITYLKQKAINLNYNDLSYSGNNSSGSQSVFRSIRRY